MGSRLRQIPRHRPICHEEGAVQQEPADTAVENQSWKVGAHSGVLVKNADGGPLHLGMTDNTFVKRQMDAYMYNAAIKTAVVINDPTTFCRSLVPIHCILLPQVMSVLEVKIRTS
ncbi:MAG: hypothetical protein ACLUD0_06745 [Eubacterium ramulus]